MTMSGRFFLSHDGFFLQFCANVLINFSKIVHFKKINNHGISIVVCVEHELDATLFSVNPKCNAHAYFLLKSRLFCHCYAVIFEFL